MATLSELTAYVRSQSLVEADDLGSASVAVLLNRGYQELAAASDWPWTATSSAVTLLDGATTIALPADFRRVKDIYDDDDDEASGWEIDPYASVIRFEEAATGDTDYTLKYYAVPDELADADEPAFDAAYHYILADYALWKLLQREEMYERANVHKGEYWETYGALRSHYNQITTPTTGWTRGETRASEVGTNTPFLGI